MTVLLFFLASTISKTVQTWLEYVPLDGEYTSLVLNKVTLQVSIYNKLKSGKVKK